MNRKINKKGFTLTEILAVIAILGVILAIAVPSYNSLSKKLFSLILYFFNIKYLTIIQIIYEV